MYLVVGGRGLTGSAILRELRGRGIEHANVQRENRRQFHGRSFDVLFFCAGSALKWKAAEDPHFDFTASVAHLSYYLHEIRAGRVVLLSDAEVYADPTSEETTHEDVPRLEEARSTYAYHKLLAEDMTRRFAPRHLVVRLPTLVGPGLRRNVVHDLVHGHRPLRELPESRLNVLHTDRMAAQLLELLQAGAEGTFNLGATDTVRLEEAAGIFGCSPAWRPEPGAVARDPQLNLDRVRSRVELESSVSALERYRGDLQGRARTA